MNRSSRREYQMTLRKLKIVPGNFKMTAAAGLGTILEVFDESPMGKEFAKCLPERVSHRSIGSYLLAMMVVAGHLHGMDCLSDIAKFKEDPYLEELFGSELAAVRTINDYLNDFEKEHVEKLNRFLAKMARTIMDHFTLLLPEPYKPKMRIVDMDSTYHEQYGDLIEGTNWNYKGEWSLESQVAFNQIGLCYGAQLHSGNTKSGTETDILINQSFKDGRTQFERKRQALDYYRADSAYCVQLNIRTLLGLGVFFTITANDATTKWKSKMEKVSLDEFFVRADLEWSGVRLVEIPPQTALAS